MSHEDTAYHAPVDSVTVPFTFAKGSRPAPRRRGFHVGWLLVCLLLVVAGAVSFHLLSH